MTYTIKTLKEFTHSITFLTKIMDILHSVNEFFLSSRKEGLGVYPNAILMTSEQLKAFTEDYPSEIKIEAIHGLKVILTDYIEEPRLLKL